MTTKLVLLRHGQSVWNLENRFTGWTDVDLTEQGREEALRSARWLQEAGFTFDLAFTSYLKRAIRTLWLVQDAMDLMWIEVRRHWALNERHYGALTGRDKKEAVRQHGEEQVHLWRRGYTVRPPPMERDDPRHPRFDPRYAAVEPELLPDTECLKDCLARVVPYYQGHILPALEEGRKVLISAHGNSLRALVKHLDGVSDEEIPKLNIPTGIPLVYDLDAGLRAVKHEYLGPPDLVRRAIEGVAGQASVKE